MRRKRLLWQLYVPYLVVILVALLAVAWYSSRALRDFYTREAKGDLNARAILLHGEAVRLLRDGDLSGIDAWAKEVGRKSSTRITIVLPSGKVAGDSEEDPAQMTNHGHRPEIIDAVEDGLGVSMRFSGTLQTEMMYVAIPMYGEGGLLGVLRVSIPLSSIQTALRSVRGKIAVGGLLVAAVAAVVSFAVSRRIALPIEEMRRGAERFARGELKTKLPRLPASFEVGGLVEAMNQMAAGLDERIGTITRQRNEIQAILSGMIEGVIAIDTDERVIMINGAASEMLGVDRRGVIGRLIQEEIRNPDVQKFVERTLSGSAPVEADIVLHQEGERFLQAHGTLLKDTEMRKVGGVVVLNDITRLRKLEGMRREFVANVSHELRTPITTIKGFVETLRDGALADRESAKRFLGIIAKQADRLNTMIDDLLTLSRIEQDTEASQITLEDAGLCEALESALQACEVEAERRDVILRLNCREDLRVEANAPLLERAVTNLIDNAIKYSNKGGIVEIGGSRQESEVVISVRDNGCGIAEEHLARIFERFYRVDKSRSQKLGGTGLGLAIVKHIAQAHRGTVGVVSTPGKGSVFTIHLPAS